MYYETYYNSQAVNQTNKQTIDMEQPSIGLIGQIRNAASVEDMDKAMALAKTFDKASAKTQRRWANVYRARKAELAAETK